MGDGPLPVGDPTQVGLLAQVRLCHDPNQFLLTTIDRRSTLRHHRQQLRETLSLQQNSQWLLYPQVKRQLRIIHRTLDGDDPGKCRLCNDPPNEWVIRTAMETLQMTGILIAISRTPPTRFRQILWHRVILNELQINLFHLVDGLPPRPTRH